MASLTLEGTWEEIQQHSDSLVGHNVRLTVLDDDESNGSCSNDRMSAALDRVSELQAAMPYTDGTKTSFYIREARDGGLFGE